MIQIYRLTPEPELMGSFSDGILTMVGQDTIKATREEILRRFNRGYWRCGEI